MAPDWGSSRHEGGRWRASVFTGAGYRRTLVVFIRSRKKKSTLALYLQGGNLAEIEKGNANLILKGWFDSSARLFINASSPGFDVRSTFSVVEVTDTGILLKALDGEAQLSITLSVPDTRLWYWEPREFSSDKEFAGLLASLPDADKYRAALGISFSGRVTAPEFADLLIPLGKIALMALWD